MEQVKDRAAWWQDCLIILALGIAIAILFSGLTLAVRGNFSECAIPSFREIIDLLAVFLSWPLAVLILGMVFMHRFRGPIAEYLQRLEDAELPGGIKLGAKQKAVAAASLPEPEKVDQVIDQVNVAAAEPADDQASLLHAARAEATYWRFSFLANFFVPNTKNVLQTFAANGRTTRLQYDSFWVRVIPDQIERQAILNALVSYNMIAEEGESIVVTDNGRAFLEFISRPFMPRPPAAPSDVVLPVRPDGSVVGFA